MALILCADMDTAADVAPALIGLEPGDETPCVLLHEPGEAEGDLEESLRTVLPGLFAVEVGSPRLARVNFDAMALVVLDLSPALLESAAGRRLADVLGGLLREGQHILLAGDAVRMCGALLAPEPGNAEELDLQERPLRAGLGLLPGAMVLLSLEEVEDLRSLLARLSAVQGRLLALEGGVAVRYDGGSGDGAPAGGEFLAAGTGSALLVAFAQGSDDETPTARLHPLGPGQRAPWPA
jgi:hypothetical protein